MTKEQQEAAITERAAYDATIAASWFTLDNAEPAQLRVWIEKLTEDIDPEYEDKLPSPRLSGEFADDPTWEDVYKDVIDEHYPLDGADELYNLYCEVFSRVVHDEVVRNARLQLAED